VIALWTECGLVRSWNDPGRDIAFARGKANSEILVGIAEGKLVSAVMVGHDGHRGWLYYVSVTPAIQGRGWGKATLRRGLAQGARRLGRLSQHPLRQCRGAGLLCRPRL
jgi:ribosomal protein S18 acetylase RimI-like enzyme